MLNNITSRSYNSSPVGTAMGVEVRTEVEVRFHLNKEKERNLNVVV